MAANDWDWNPEKQKSIVVQQVDAIAIYTNVRGEIVIRQQGFGGEVDAIVAFPRAMPRLSSLHSPLRRARRNQGCAEWRHCQ
jgi:hypothetical protein